MNPASPSAESTKQVISDQELEAYLRQPLSGYGLEPDAAARSPQPGRSPTRLTVVYDEQCELCRRCHRWLAQQQTYVPLAFLAAGSPDGQRLYATLPWYRSELMVVADDGQAWVGPSAFIISLWATCRYRTMSYRLQRRAFAPLVESFFHALSSRRAFVSELLSPHACDDGTCPVAPR